MVDTYKDIIQSATRATLDVAQKKLSAAELACFTPFVERFFNVGSTDFFKKYPAEQLFALAYSSYHQMEKRPKQKISLQITNPTLKKNGWDAFHSVLQVTIADIPFAVDSVRMLLNRYGLNVHYLLHVGGLKVSRTAGRKVKDIQAFSPTRKVVLDPCYRSEAVIYIEFDRQEHKVSIKKLHDNLLRVLADVEIAVTDWPALEKHMRDAIAELSSKRDILKQTDISESVAYLEWVLADRFTILGYREYVMRGRGDNRSLHLKVGSGLGVLRDETHSKHVRFIRDLPKAAQKAALSPKHALLISKTNTRSTVHRPAYTDYIGVKVFDDSGRVIGERRFIGLYTSLAYVESPSAIPFIREKVAKVLRRSALPEYGHSGKELLHILSNLPRDDLFHASNKQLFDLAMNILHMQERHVTRLFLRQDLYGRYISCFVFMPRENFSTSVVRRLQQLLLDTFDSKEASTSTFFSESVLVRVHFNVRLDTKKTLKFDELKLREQVIAIASSWYDHVKKLLVETYGDQGGTELATKYRYSCPISYVERSKPRQIVFDIRYIEKLVGERVISMSFFKTRESNGEYRFKLYRRDDPVALSEVVPLLENMGLRVLREEPFEIKFHDGKVVWINDFTLRPYPETADFDFESVRKPFQETFYRTWHKEAESDGFNRLVLSAELGWRAITVLRAYMRYFQQVKFTFSRSYVRKVLVKNKEATKLLVAIFDAKFDPQIKRDEKQLKQLEEKFKKALKSVTVLDDDRILRMFRAAIKATLRTNCYQRQKDGSYYPYLSFKLNPRVIPGVPLPLPAYEMFVYSPRFEGIHLRMDKVARGGLRWSDRPEDFRTEVLGLMKAQQVKNSLIVPAGAKGGFVPKGLPWHEGREAVFAEAVDVYKQFISALLELADNYVGDKVVSPPDVVIYDEEDPYLVVAADKGTASFSDIANSISLEKGFWLGDAFASGGSTGYDHKKMGITARGAWISALRHFQELGVNLADTPITVVGIGDMSGDVFGNGVLCSPHLKVVAAFNHMHIFLDPNPKPAESFAERQRLFNLPRSTWADYSPELISRGGGVYERSAKLIKLSAAVRKRLGIEATELRPDELICAILKAPVDMVWNGGIGTYVKAATETNADVGDRANDNVRVNGMDMRAQVVAEGGNLGLTQLGRVEYELAGGRLNTDFIDNSAGVDCSDHEVNIKILLNTVMQQESLTEAQRNRLLASMSDEVAELVLVDNYLQNQALSLATLALKNQTALYLRYIEYLETHGGLNRELEFLPTTEALAERKLSGKVLTRPELAILLAYSKNMLKEQLMNSDLLEDEWLAQYIMFAFPKPLQKKYAKQIRAHRLGPQIIITQLCNHLLADMSLTFIYRIQEETDASIVDIVRTYVVVSNVFHMTDVIEGIDALDYKLPAELQYEMLGEVTRVVRRATLWFLRNRRDGVNIRETIECFTKPVELLFVRLPKLLVGEDRQKVLERKTALEAKGVPAALAEQIACARPTYHTLNIIEITQAVHLDIYKVAKIYFTIAQKLNILWLREVLVNFPAQNRWTVLAKAGLKSELDHIQRQITVNVIALEGGRAKTAVGLVNAWVDTYQPQFNRCKNTMIEVASGQADFDILSVAVRQLLELVRVSRA